MTYGNGDSDAFTFDKNTLRPTSYGFTVNSTTESATLTNNTNGDIGQLAINDPFNRRTRKPAIGRDRVTDPPKLGQAVQISLGIRS